MRTHGWSGAAPASDDEAVARILDAAGKAIDARGADFSITDVARTLGVTRQTVYRYFPSTDALLVAAAVYAADDFQDRLETHLRGITDPVEAVTEAIATALEWLPKDKHLGLLIVPGRANPHIESVTGDVALDFGHSMVRRFDVDWAGLGFSDDDLHELAEHLLRIIQSFVTDPGRPPRTGEELRGTCAAGSAQPSDHRRPSRQSDHRRPSRQSDHRQRKRLPRREHERWHRR